MSNNRNFKFPAFLLLVIALFAFGALTAFASDDLGGGGGSPRPTLSADLQDVITLNEDVLAELVSHDTALMLIYEPFETEASVAQYNLVGAAGSLIGLNETRVAEWLGEWQVETNGSTYHVRLVAVIPAA